METISTVLIPQFYSLEIRRNEINIFITTSTSTSSVPYLLLMVKFFILAGDFCFSIASRVSCLEVAKQTPLCTLDFVCRVQLMYDVWPDFLSGDTEWT